jgi:hypothetical protein
MNRLKRWQNSNTWGRHQEIRMTFTVKSRVDLSSRLISKNLKIKIYKTVILPVVLYGYET